MSSSRRERLRLGALALAMAATTSCSAVRDAVLLDPPPDRVSIRAYELDLAYGTEPAAEAAAAPLPPLAPVPLAEVAVDLFDLPAASTAPGPVRSTIMPEEPCPPPGPGVVATRPVTPDVRSRVEPGAYLFQQSGTVELVGLASFPLPPLTARIVRNVVVAGEQFDFDVELFTGLRRQVQRFQVRPGDGVFLRGIDTTVNGETIAFNPVAPVEVFPLPASENTPITSVGLDPLTGQTLVVQGVVVRKDRVLGCNEVVDGWVVDAQWSFTRPSLDGGTETRTYEYDYTVATQHGGLVVADRLATVTPENYGPVVADLEVTSAIGSVTPKPEPEPAP